MEYIIEKISEFRLIPVVTIEHTKDAIPLASALKRGGLACAEVTFRTDAAKEAIREIHSMYPDFFVGAGTILTQQQADDAISAGARFLVSPGLNPEIIKYCQSKKYPIIPGVCTPSEVEQAIVLGLKYLKFFPSEAAGGIKMIKAMTAPYSMVRFMPTGGICPDNLMEYLCCDAVYACGGSWMVPADKITLGKFKEIEKLTNDAVNLVNIIRRGE